MKDQEPFVSAAGEMDPAPLAPNSETEATFDLSKKEPAAPVEKAPAAGPVPVASPAVPVSPGIPVSETPAVMKAAPISPAAPAVSPPAPISAAAAPPVAKPAPSAAPAPPYTYPQTYGAAPAGQQFNYNAGQKYTYPGAGNPYAQQARQPIAAAQTTAAYAPANTPAAPPAWPGGVSATQTPASASRTPAAPAPSGTQTSSGQSPASPYQTSAGQAANAAASPYAVSSYNINNNGQTAYSPYSMPSPAPKTRTKKPTTARSAIVICIILTLIISPLLGFAGSLVARSLVPAASENIVAMQDSSNPWSDVVDSIMESSASIYISASGGIGWSGSGAVITSDGFILTNWHVAGDPSVRSIDVVLYDGTEYSATVVARAEDIDTTLIKINARNLTHVKIGDSGQVKVGDEALGIGNPLGENPDTVSEGIISHLVRNVDVGWESAANGVKTFKLLQTTVSITGGNSGGGLYNYRGELIGLNSAGVRPDVAENIAFAVPINDILQFLNSSGDVSISRDSSLYIQTEAAATRGAAEQLGGDNAGVIITAVEKYGAGYYAGLRAGDRVVSADGRTFTTDSDFNSYISSLAINTTVELIISRGGQQYLYTIKTMRLPQS